MPKPTLQNWCNLHGLHFWCHKILPLVYDDSLSYYEVLCKLRSYLNCVVSDMNTLREFVVTWFDELDIEDELRKVLCRMGIRERVDRLIQMVEDVNARVDTIETRISSIESRVSSTETRITNIETRTTTIETILDEHGVDITNLQNAIRALISILNETVAAETFVRYYRDTSVDDTTFRWNATAGAEYNLDIYMDANGSSAGSQNADRDYIVVVSNCTDMHDFDDLHLQQVAYSSGDTRPLATIRRLQGQHPCVTLDAVTSDFSWAVTTATIVRQGEHLKVNALVDHANGNSPWFRLHQFNMTWIPIAPIDGYDIDDILPN